MQIIFPENVIKIIEILNKNGKSAYAVGGCIRDSLMGRVPFDWDITTSATPDEMLEIFAAEGIRTIPTGLSHGTVSVLLDDTTYECTTYRTDGTYTDSRHPDFVLFTSDIRGDLARRDFTVNAIAAHPNGEFIDVFGGIEDIKNKTIRCVGASKERFSEDALRILRALRFSATLGFKIEKSTFDAAFITKKGLANVSVERKISELSKMIVSAGADDGIKNMFKLGLENYIIKGLKKPKISLLSVPATLESRMAALLSATPSIDLSALKLSKKQLSGIKMLMQKPIFDGEADSDVLARRVIRFYGAQAAEVCEFYGCMSLKALVEKELEAGACVTISALAINGTHLISLGVEKHKISSYLAMALELVIEHPEKNNEADLIEFIKNKL